MIQNTFKHVIGVTSEIEKLFWRAGILDWNDLLQENTIDGCFTEEGLQRVKEELELSKRRLADHDIKFFADRLPRNEHWRLFKDFRSHFIYLDIETTGFSHNFDNITVIGLYDGIKTKSFVKGDNMDEFNPKIDDSRVLVSFNGSRFDIPFLNNEIGFKPPRLSIDLFDEFRNLGYGGGMKALEETFNIDRGEFTGIDGKSAIRLWAHFKYAGKRDCLEKLVKYNQVDVLNLEKLMVIVYNEHASRLKKFGLKNRIPRTLKESVCFA